MKNAKCWGEQRVVSLRVAPRKVTVEDCSEVFNSIDMNECMRVNRPLTLDFGCFSNKIRNNASEIHM